MKPTDIIYDEECYPNIWTLMASPCDSGKHYLFEISPRVNDYKRLIEFIQWCKFHKHRMVGFNNLAYDYPILHWMLQNGDLNRFSQPQLNDIIYQKSNAIISTPWEDRFSNTIYPNKEIVRQVDLLKIHHFDNRHKIKRASLKMLEINMRLPFVEDLPFPVGTILTLDQMQILVNYNKYDVFATKKFYNISLPLIQFRDKLTKKLNRDFINHNDAKIGKDFLVMELEKRLGPECCYTRRPRKSRQTIRGSMKLGELIFPEIKFRTEEFNSILEFFQKTETSETKGVFDNLSCTFSNGLKCDFGMGGIHAFIKPMHIESCSKYAIIDLDVEGYYGSLSVSKRLFPEHLSEVFCDIMGELKIQRKQHDKGTPENSMLKLSINGAWGSSNDKWSPFYDKKYAMQTTINGQLFLCMFAEMIMLIPDTTILQMNTDGLTIKIPRVLEPLLMKFKKHWCDFTGLNLEYQYYVSMWLKNVNSYLAIDVIGKVTRKKDYDYEKKVGANIAWSKNFSMLVVPKAAEAYLTRGCNISDFVRNHKDDFDFCLSVKLNRSQNLMWGDDEIQRTTRYYVSKSGKPLIKIDKELTRITRQKQEILQNEILQGRDGAGLFKLTKSGKPTPLTPVNRIACVPPVKGWNTTICNDGIIDRKNINYDFYIQEVKKLTDPVTG